MTKVVKLRKILEADRKLRDVRASYQFVTILFSIWALIRFPALFIWASAEFSLGEKIFHNLSFVFILGVAILSIKRYKELGLLRENLISKADKLSNFDVSGPPVVSTLLPFVFNAYR